MKKKNYNPFKMWGSWIGVSLGFLLEQYYAYTLDLNYFLKPVIIKIIELNLPSLIVFSIIGFLLGWGIHSLIRRFK